MDIFAVKSLGSVEEYIEIEDDFAAKKEVGGVTIREACQKSEVQFLNKEKIIITAKDSGGMEFPDMLVTSGIYLFSNRVMEQIKADIKEYVFLKPAEVVCDVIGKKELYWIVVPPKIDCLDLDNSEVNYDWNFELLGIMPVLQCKKIVIDEQLTGNYKMFKIAGIDDNSIYVNETLQKKILSVNPEGIKLIKTKEE